MDALRTNGSVPGHTLRSLVLVVATTLVFGLLLVTRASSSPAEAATAAVPAAAPARAKVKGRQLRIKVKGSRLGRKARIILKGYRGPAKGGRKAVRVRNTRTVKGLKPGRYRIVAKRITRNGSVARAKRIAPKRVTLTKRSGARTTVTYRRVKKSASGRGWWRPVLGTDWQWQLSGQVDLGVESAVFDIDGEDASAGLVRSLHRRGAKVICYIDVGAWETYRRDAGAFPRSVKGNSVGGWPQERWLDIRRLDVLLPIMERRIRNCAAKGFDGLEPDLMDGFSNQTGFPLTYRDQIVYNKAIARLAHKYGLGVALKNDPEQVADLERFFDFAVVEECVRYHECGEYLPFTRNGKAVLHVEYQGSRSEFCGFAKPLRFSSMKKRYSLDGWRSVCP